MGLALAGTVASDFSSYAYFPSFCSCSVSLCSPLPEYNTRTGINTFGFWCEVQGAVSMNQLALQCT